MKIFLIFGICAGKSGDFETEGVLTVGCAVARSFDEEASATPETSNAISSMMSRSVAAAASPSGASADPLSPQPSRGGDAERVTIPVFEPALDFSEPAAALTEEPDAPDWPVPVLVRWGGG